MSPAANNSSDDQQAQPAAGRGKQAGAGPLPFRLSDQWLLGGACALALLALAAYCLRASRWGTEPIELDRLQYKIDLHSADWVEWSGLPGIGPVLAKRIVEDRDRNGAFRDLDDLMRVPGIGPKRIEAIRPFVLEKRGDSKGPTEGNRTEGP